MPIREALASVSSAPPVAFGGLTVTPLVGDDDPACDSLTLDEALAAGVMHITEVSDAGRVTELRVRNTAPKPVLIIDGEELVGAKQNRVINLTVLVAASSETTIPVSYVEAGRWRHRTRELTAAPRPQFATGRAAKMAQVSRAMTDTGDRRSDQGLVWDAIAWKALRMDARSDTAAMSAIYDRPAASLESFVERVRPADRQRGAVYSIDGSPRGLELFDCAGTFRGLADKLIRSYAIDAMEVSVPDPRQPAAEDVMRFIATTCGLTATTFPAIGEGQDVRLTGERAVGAALVAYAKVVHLAAFAEASLPRRSPECGSGGTEAEHGA